MSHHITTPVLACFYGSGNLMLLAIALADACPDASGKNIYKAVARLAHESRTSVRTAQSALRRLQADGWLVKDSAGNGGRGHATRYRVDADWLARARQEIADASLDNRPPALVPPPVAWASETKEALDVKGAEVAPFMPVDNYPQRVQPEAVKGAEKRLKGEAAVAPEQGTEYLNTPLPPILTDGGLSDFQNLESEHPKSGPSDHRAAWRQWRRMRRAGRLTPPTLAAMRKRLPNGVPA